MEAPALNNAEYYRRRAAEVRALSAEFVDTELRALMIRMAREYEELADRSADQVAFGVPLWTPPRHQCTS
jgi:hypothetical protein